MSQRLARTTISMPPRTVIGFRKDHSPIYNIAGGSVDAGVEPVAGAGTEGTEPPVEPPTGDAGNAGENKDPDALDKALERMRAADRAKSTAEATLAELQKQLREYEDKDKTELERAQRDAQEAQARAEAAEANLKKERVNNAFLLNNTVAWHNPQTALSLLDLSDVTIGDDGSVKGIDKAIDALSKSDPYLVKPKDDTSGKDLPPSGSQVGSGNSRKDAKPDREQLLAKYPALRR